MGILDGKISQGENDMRRLINVRQRQYMYNYRYIFFIPGHVDVRTLLSKVETKINGHVVAKFNNLVFTRILDPPVRPPYVEGSWFGDDSKDIREGNRRTILLQITNGEHHS